jgi:hypothetical protein
LEGIELKWTVIEDFAPTKKWWVQLAYRHIDSVREYRMLANFDGAEIDCEYRQGSSEENKQEAYAQYRKAEEVVNKSY